MSDTSSDTVTKNSNSNIFSSWYGNPTIPVVVNLSFRDRRNPPPWFEANCKRKHIQPVRKTIYRNNKLLDAQCLPTISVSNLRSLFPKLKNFKNDVLQREIGLSLLSEVWEKKGKKKHIHEIENMLQMEGLKYISTPRPSSKRGGGCAIVADLTKFTMEKIEVTIPKSVEVTYGLLRAKNDNAKFREIIAVAFYSPPKSRKKSILLDHIITTCQVLLTKYPRAVLVIGGDRNEMSITPLLDSIPKLKQINTKNTCNGKVLDVLMINIPEYYPTPCIVPPVPADNPAKGVPSDHSTIIATPMSNPDQDNKLNEYTVKTCRPLPESGKNEFGKWITRETWEGISHASTPDEQVEVMQKLIAEKLDTIFPPKSVRISQKDKPYINADLKKLDKLVKREYRKHGKSVKYLKLVEKYKKKMRKKKLLLTI